MATQEDILEARVGDLLRELTAIRGSDGEAMFLIGNLAGSLLKDAKVPTWASLKARLDGAAYDQLLLSAQAQGNALTESKNYRAAFALDVVITSIVASRFDNPRLGEGVALIDDTIERAVSAWREHNAKAVN